VTVIFLPLSFVTGYLGMNVDDVRNMGQKQGIFWIIAMPITFVNFSVILLLIMGPNLKKRYLKAKME
jgi:Mg2+ and Co2+ transporter CorA